MQLSTSAGLGKQTQTLEHGDSWEKVSKEGPIETNGSHMTDVLRCTATQLDVPVVLKTVREPTISVIPAIQEHFHGQSSFIGTAYGVRSLELGIDLVNIFSEVCLIALPTALMPQVQTTVQIQILVIVCFACRTAVIGTLGGHISSLRHLEDFDDPSWSYTMPAIWSQVVMNISILTAAIPGMQQFLADLRSGMTTLTVRDAHQETSNSASVFGANSRARATAYSDSKGNSWELSKLDSVMRSKGGTRQERRHSESESVERLTPHPNNIVVTREFASYIED
ncbi:hypothetical protein LTR86_005904 [Recurvomyces mirabilis]|nr:hypothetical protein LTR86_005904 [Recurvomyces mirabilis]